MGCSAEEVCDDGNTIGGDYCGSDCGTSGWHTFYGNDFTHDWAYEIAVDGEGGIYVAGEASESWTGPCGEAPLNAFSGDNVFILKLSPTGAYQWHTFYGSGSMGWDMARSVSVDGSGNVYATGLSMYSWTGPSGETPLHAHSWGDTDIFVLKLSPTGAYQWHTFYGSIPYSMTVAESIAVDSDSSVLVTGYSDSTWHGPSGEDPLHEISDTTDLFVLKLSTSGAYQWHTFYGGGGGSVGGRSIAVDASDDVYVTGGALCSWTGPDGESPLHPFTFNDIVVLKLSSSGEYQWHTFYGSSEGESGSSVAVDGTGDVYVAGGTQAAWTGASGESPLHVYSGSNDLFVLALSSNGAYQWHTFYGSSSGDYGNSLAIDGSGDLVVAGGSGATWTGSGGEEPLHAYSGGSDLLVLALSMSGAYMWHTFYGSVTDYTFGDDTGYSCALDASNSIYLTGFSPESWSGPNGESPLHAKSGAPGDDDLFVLKLAH